uniref:Uncharacterized protein n=1 Tax=Tanacetum cinerariifolium TaxID=118510 RepID=A0A699IBT5_TANCI|nr:hypothetical protein [Tanacetum cinerariifolium]
MSSPSYQSPVNNYSLVSKGFQPKFTPKLIQSSPNSSSQADLKFQKDYKAEYKKMKAKLALLEGSPSSSQNPKTSQPKIKGELLNESLSKMNINENSFIHASMDYGYEMVPKSKDWVERLSPDSKLPNFNTRRILVPKSQAGNESLKPTEVSTDPESSSDSVVNPSLLYFP